MNQDHRPVNLALTKFRFPLAAIASISHRVTGVVLFGGVAFLLYALGMATDSHAGFAYARDVLFASPLVKLLLWFLLAALSYHFVAGIKHMILEFGFGETLKGGRIAAQITFALSALLTVLAGIWIW